MGGSGRGYARESVGSREVCVGKGMQRVAAWCSGWVSWRGGRKRMRGSFMDRDYTIEEEGLAYRMMWPAGVCG